MKTKTKILTMVGIAIVLCSLLLVTLPVIAAEQTTQEVSASEVTTASDDDYVLDIYGNANEDDTIDMRDLTYVKLIFFGKKPETELADAKYDGKINPLDFIQIKLIIVGKEKELTIVQYIEYYFEKDITEEPVTINMPIKTIIAMGGSYDVETLCAFGASDRIIGVNKYAERKEELKTFIENNPSLGGAKTWDIEKMIYMKPDIVTALAYYDYSDYRRQLNAAGIPLVQMDVHRSEKSFKVLRILGWMLGNKERAEELINFEQQHLDLIKERVKDLKEEQKPQVYFEGAWSDYKSYGPGSSSHDTIITCGGINIFADASTKYPKIDPEAVLERNPQVVIKSIESGTISQQGYGVTDTGPMEELRNSIMSRPGWNNIDAVKNGRVYLLSVDAKSTHACVYYSYVAKWLHPDKFQDMDPVDIHGEWLKKFLGIEFKGVYAYPILS